jgi:hypothetical protein
MAFLVNWLRHYRNRRHVRPWALAVPVVVLLIAVPLLRPLRHPDCGDISDDELARLATVQSLVEQNTLSIDESRFFVTRTKVERNGHWYSNQPPLMAVLLAGPYRAMRWLGYGFDSSPDWVMFILTLLGTTLPVAGAGGLLYRMGRLFELRRPARTGLALAVVLGSGLISYATVLNAHAPAAALVLASAACLVHVTITNRRMHGSVWLIASGACAALAAALEPAAVVFVLLFAAVVLAVRWTTLQRVGGLLVDLVGAADPLRLHVSLAQRTTGNVWQGSGLGSHEAAAAVEAAATAPAAATLRGQVVKGLAFPADKAPPSDGDFDADERAPRSAWESLGTTLGRVTAALLGRHGVLSHFPVVLLGILGVTMVMHRHWPPTTKVLATATLVGATAMILLYAFRALDWTQAMFGTRWFVAFLPLTVFWGGVWLRRRHRPVSWAIAGLLLAFSIAVSLLGATGPLPRDGFNVYTASGAAKNLLHPAAEDAGGPSGPAAFAGAALRDRAADGP